MKLSKILNVVKTAVIGLLAIQGGAVADRSKLDCYGTIVDPMDMNGRAWIYGTGSEAIMAAALAEAGPLCVHRSNSPMVFIEDVNMAPSREPKGDDFIVVSEGNKDDDIRVVKPLFAVHREKNAVDIYTNKETPLHAGCPKFIVCTKSNWQIGPSGDTKKTFPEKTSNMTHTRIPTP